jgi:gluconolactonase
MEALVWGYGLIEGPRADGEGGLYFSDVTRGGVYRRSSDGEVMTVVPKRRGVGGIALHADGGVVVSGRNVCHVRNGETRLLFERPDIPGFNDLFTDVEGAVYVGSLRSDPFRGGDRVPGELWRIGVDGEASELYGGVGLSNGIGFSPDGRRLYHCDTAARSILVSEPGRTKPEPFARLEVGAPDGLAVDADGGVWVASFGGGCVLRYAPDGRLDRRLEVPARNVTSLCFGAEDRRDLLVATADNREDAARNGTIFRTRCSVAGLPAPPARV